MTSLIVCVSDDNGTWGHVKRVIESEEWDRVYVVACSDAAKGFSCPKDTSLIAVDGSKHIPDIEKEIIAGLSGRISDFEVAVNFVSGRGKEHMAFMSAVLKLGVGVRLVVLTKDGVREL